MSAKPASRLKPIDETISAPSSREEGTESYRVDTPLPISTVSYLLPLLTHSGMIIVNAAPTNIPMPSTVRTCRRTPRFSMPARTRCIGLT